MCLRKGLAEVLTPSTAECDLIWKWDLFRDNLFRKDNPLEGALIRYDWCPYKKGKFGHRDRRAQREDKVKTQGEEGPVPKVTIYKPRESKDCPQAPELDGARQDSAPGPAEEAWPSPHLGCRYVAMVTVRQQMSAVHSGPRKPTQLGK